MIYAGCDLGIVAAKAVVIDEDSFLGFDVLPYKNLPRHAAETVMATTLSSAGMDDEQPAFCMSTGYGRRAVEFSDDTILDVACLHRAVKEINPAIRTVIDIGGHTLQIFTVNKKGCIMENVSIQRCITGTGLFLDVMARVLEMPLEEILAASLEAKDPTPLTSQCVVQAESEVVSRVNEGKDRRDIFAGVVSFTAIRISSVIRKVKLRGEVAFAGGMAKNKYVRRHLERNLEVKFDSLGGLDPQVMSAYGAALLARDREK